MNIVASLLSPGERAFIDQITALLTPFGMPSAAARLYGLLLVSDDGPISLDQIAATLQMSRANAWYAARALERSGHARRSVEQGSKRVFFQIASDVVPPTLEQQGLLTTMGNLLGQQAEEARSEAVAERLEEKARFCFLMRDAIEGAIAEIRADRQKARRSGVA